MATTRPTDAPASADLAPAPALYPRLLRGLWQVERRLRWAEAARWAPWVGAVALGGALLAALAARVWPLADGGLLVAGAGLMLALALGGSTAWALLRRRARLDTARRGDAALALAERLATAMEAQEQPRPALRPAEEQQAHIALLGHQLADATAHLEAALPALPAALPLAPPRTRRAWALPIALALAVLVATFAPNPLAALWQQQQQVQQQIKQEQQRLEELRREIAARPGDPNDPTRQAILQELQDLQRNLSAGDLTREEGLARISETEAQLQQLVDAQAPGDKAALDALGRQLQQSENAAAQQAGAALQNNKPGDAAKAIQDLGRQAGQMSDAERQKLADQLRQAAQDAAANNPDLAQRLNDAATALASQDPTAAQKALDTLAQTVDQMGQQQLSQQELQQTLAQLQAGKQALAQAGQATPVAQNGTPQPQNGTPVAQNGTPQPQNGTPIALNGTPMQIAGTGTPIHLAQTGTPVVVQGTPGQGTPVVVQGQGQQGQGQQGQPGQSAGSNQPGNGHQEPIAVPPSTLNAQGTPVGLTARPNDQGQASTGSVNTAPNGGAVQVPYNDVYGSYAAQAQQSLGQQYIPSGMKEYVQDYFTSLDPQQR